MGLVGRVTVCTLDRLWGPLHRLHGADLIGAEDREPELTALDTLCLGLGLCVPGHSPALTAARKETRFNLPSPERPLWDVDCAIKEHMRFMAQRRMEAYVLRCRSDTLATYEAHARSAAQDIVFRVRNEQRAVHAASHTGRTCRLYDPHAAAARQTNRAPYIPSNARDRYYRYPH